jgi:hypothetical protein
MDAACHIPKLLPNWPPPLKLRRLHGLLLPLLLLQVLPEFLATHFALTVVVPCLLAYAWDSYGRKAFEAAEVASSAKCKGSPRWLGPE